MDTGRSRIGPHAVAVPRRSRSASSPSSRRSSGWCSAPSRPRASCASRRPPGGRRPRRWTTTRSCSRGSASARTSSTRRSSPWPSPSGNLLFCSMLGYALAKLDFTGKRALFVLVMATLMVPGRRDLRAAVRAGRQHGAGGHAARADPAVPGGPFGVFLMRQFILGLPRRADRRRPRRRRRRAPDLRRIVLPLCGPALATLGILTFLGSWNNFLWPLVVAQTEDKYTLPVALALYSTGQNSTQYGLLLAGATVVVLPVLVVFLLFQRRFIEGHRHHRHQVTDLQGESHEHAAFSPASTPSAPARRRRRRRRPRAGAAPPRPPSPPRRPPRRGRHVARHRRPLRLDTHRLLRWAADTWRSLDAMTDPGTGLPADNISGRLARRRQPLHLADEHRRVDVEQRRRPATSA